MSHLAPLLAVALLNTPQEPPVRVAPPAPADERLPWQEISNDRTRNIALRNALGAGPVVLPAAVARRTVVISGNRRIELESPPDPPTDRVEVWLGVPGNRPVAIQAMILSRDNFDRLVFEASGADPADPRAHLHERLEDRIRAVEAGRPLDEAERRRLRLAGTGDIERFLGRVEAARAEFEVDRRRYSTGMAAVRRLELLEVQYREGPFGNGSLFRKVTGAAYHGR